MRTRVGRLALVLVVAAGLGASCATRTVAPPASETAPSANSPANALRRFEWAMNHKDADMIRGLLADHLVLVSAGLDSAGNPSRGPYHDRTWLCTALAALVDTAASVRLLLDQDLFTVPDSRPGHDPKWHQQVRSALDLTVDGPAGRFEVTGNLLLFVTRGDSAEIPLDQLERGARPDSTRWWLDRFEDETLGAMALPAATEPSQSLTFTTVLEYFYSLRAR